MSWAQQFEEVVWLDSNFHKTPYTSFDSLLAVDAFTSISTDWHSAFDKLKEYQKLTNDWILGYLTYDLKNDVEDLSSNNGDHLYFHELFFFQPKKIIRIIGDKVEFIYLNLISDEMDNDYNMIMDGENLRAGSTTYDPIKIKMRIFKDTYFKRIYELLEHIHRGDVYEANYCQEFYAENTKIDVLRTYQKLNTISRAPFAAFLKLNDTYMLSASPERYLKKIGNKVISQPIKGTAKRSANTSEDKDLKLMLAKDPKERSENIMIVDLVRNDLSKSALKGTVKVEELCKVYSFEQVHQMISTVTAIVEENKNPVEIIRESFPMGSMTGAPKVSAMKIIEELESFKRGLYSGAIGYITPEGDFDFNVVIRSILYNSSENYVSFSVGGAITSNSNPQMEYEECLLKAKAMREVLENLGREEEKIKQ